MLEWTKLNIEKESCDEAARARTALSVATYRSLSATCGTIRTEMSSKLPQTQNCSTALRKERSVAANGRTTAAGGGLTDITAGS
jgi:hypothetical protein